MKAPAVLTLEPGLAAKPRSCGQPHLRTSGHPEQAPAATKLEQAPALQERQRAAAGWTANSAEAGEMRLSAAVSTANIAAVADGEWAVIAPYGDHPSPDGSYVQRFDRSQADKVVKTWNSITGVAARFFKNVAHGLGATRSLPVWDGHPETDQRRWPKAKLIAEVTEIRAGDGGLEGRVTWNAQGMARRTAGPLYPSPLWWHWPPSGEPPTVYPELLESIGLVPTPNISAVPAWTGNARLEGDADGSTESRPTNDCMNETQLKELRKALGLPENADAAAILTGATTANAARVQLTERETALTTANSAKAELETQLSTANGKVTTLTTERDNLQTANAALTTEVAKLRRGILDLAEKRGAITPAERPAFETRLATANTADAALAELPGRKAMNTLSVEINGSRVDLSTANARQSALNAAVAKRQKEHGEGYDEAFAAVQADPQYAALFAAMQDPTRKQ